MRGPAPRSGRGKPSRSTGASSASSPSALRSHRRERTSAFRLPVPPRSGAVPLEVARLGVRYGDNEVLSDVNFHAGRGDRVVVVGRNGAGKSCLLRCLAGVQEPTDGAVEPGRQRRPSATSPRSTSRSTWTCTALGQRRRRRARDRAPSVGHSSARSASPARRPTRCRPRSRAASGPSSAWPCWLGRRGQPAPARRADQQPRPLVDRGRGRHAWELARHHRGREPRPRPSSRRSGRRTASAARGALHPLARGVSRRRGDAVGTQSRPVPSRPRPPSPPPPRPWVWSAAGARRSVPTGPWIVKMLIAPASSRHSSALYEDPSAANWLMK